MNHHDSVFSPVLQQSGWIKNRIWGIQDGKKSWNFHQTVSCLRSIQEKIFKLQFSCLLTEEPKNGMRDLCSRTLNLCYTHLLNMSRRQIPSLERLLFWSCLTDISFFFQYHFFIILTNYKYSHSRNLRYNTATHVNYSLRYNNSYLHYLQWHLILPPLLLDTRRTTATTFPVL